MKRWLAPALAGVSAAFVILAVIFQWQLGPYLGVVLRWVIILGAAGLLAAMVLLMLTHLRKIGSSQKGIIYSLVLLGSFGASLAGGLILGVENDQYLRWIGGIIRPLETSLLGLLALVMAGAAFKLFRLRGWSPLSISFAVFALIFLILGLGFLQGVDNPALAGVIAFLRRLPLVGARGLLIGMGLGLVFLGLRVIFGIERPYGD